MRTRQALHGTARNTQSAAADTRQSSRWQTIDGLPHRTRFDLRRDGLGRDRLRRDGLRRRALTGRRAQLAETARPPRAAAGVVSVAEDLADADLPVAAEGLGLAVNDPFPARLRVRLDAGQQSDRGKHPGGQ